MFDAKPGSILNAIQHFGKALAELATPLAHCFIGHNDTPSSQYFLYVEVAQGETVVQPDRVTDDFIGITVTGVRVCLCFHSEIITRH